MPCAGSTICHTHSVRSLQGGVSVHARHTHTVRFQRKHSSTLHTVILCILQRQSAGALHPLLHASGVAHTGGVVGQDRSDHKVSSHIPRIDSSSTAKAWDSILGPLCCCSHSRTFEHRVYSRGNCSEICVYVYSLILCGMYCVFDFRSQILCSA
jgi:hypothetical protein